MGSTLYARAGSAAENGPAVHGGMTDRRGNTRRVAGDDFKAPRSASGLGKRRLQEVAGGPGRQDGGTARARGRAGALERGRRRGLPENVGLAMFD
jgi:hypothetical protein